MNISQAGILKLYGKQSQNVSNPMASNHLNGSNLAPLNHDMICFTSKIADPMSNIKTMMNKETFSNLLKEGYSLKNKTVLLLADFNVPMKNGQITDDTRIRETLETIGILMEEKAKTYIVCHLGRPKGKVTPENNSRTCCRKIIRIHWS